MTDEEKKAIERAISNITRGIDIESAMLILEKCALDGLIIIRGRINIFKTAVRQILEFLKEYKDKGYLDVVREKVKANETVEKQSKEIEYWKAGMKIIEKDKNNHIERLERKIKELDSQNEVLEEIKTSYEKKTDKLLKEKVKKEKEIEELKEENEKYKNPPFFDEENYTSNDKIKAILEEYKYTEIGDSEKIIEFYKKMQSLLEKE